MSKAVANLKRPNRREFLKITAAGVPFWTDLSLFAGGDLDRGAVKQVTEFQIACMTLPYSQFPLQRALTGIQSAGYKFVAWGTMHKEADGQAVPLLPADAPTSKAKELGTHCRDLGLMPLLMFSGIYPEAQD